MAFDRSAILEGIVEQVPQLNDWRANRAATFLLSFDQPEAKDAVRSLTKRRSFVPFAGEIDYWANLDVWLSKPPLERCLAHTVASDRADALALLDVADSDAQMVFDTLMDRQQRTHGDDDPSLPGYFTLAMTWLLADAAADLVEANIGRLRSRSWVEKFEVAALAGRHGIPGFVPPPAQLSPARPHWVPQYPPVMARELLGGALLRCALARTDRDFPYGHLVDELPGRWVIYGDLDDMKHLSDYHGHLAGDLAIHGSIAAFQSIVGDRVIRFGGDEFLVLYEGEDGPALAERLRVAVEQAQFGPAGHIDEPLSRTISFGVVPAGHFAATMRAAEEALSQAKSAGKNRVVVGTL